MRGEATNEIYFFLTSQDEINGIFMTKIWIFSMFYLFETHAFDKMYLLLEFHEYISLSLRDMLKDGWGTCFNIVLV